MTNFRGRIVAAPLIWIDGEFRKNVHMKIDDEGRIEKIGTDLGSEEVVHLANLVGLILISKITKLLQIYLFEGDFAWIRERALARFSSTSSRTKSNRTYRWRQFLEMAREYVRTRRRDLL